MMLLSFSYLPIAVLLFGHGFVASEETDRNQEGKHDFHQHENHEHGEGPQTFGDDVPSASTARWLVEESIWGTVGSIGKNPLMREDENTGLVANVLPIAVSPEQGRIFFYLMGDTHIHGVSLTVSQAALNSALFASAACGTKDSAVDAQDPRCGKLTIQGSIHPCSSPDVGENCEEVGKVTLFEKHPTMREWPEDHHFQVHELVISEDLWMIANFGGGGVIHPSDYWSAKPVEHKIVGGDPVSASTNSEVDPPAWNHYALRSRWIVHHSHWATVSTLSASKTDDSVQTAFGNIRSVVDGMDWESSTGLPIFYLPDVDPTAVDMSHHNGQIVLTFSEAAIAERVQPDGSICAGQEVGNPTCAQVALYGTAIPYERDDYSFPFKKFHPLASWLAGGGSHMSGKYYTIELDRVRILDYFGGFHEVPVNEVNVKSYLNVKPSLHLENADTNKGALPMSLVALVIGFSIGLWCGVRKSSPNFVTHVRGSTAKHQYHSLNEGAIPYDDSMEMEVMKDEEPVITRV